MRPVLVRNTSSRLGRCSSIEPSGDAGARRARAGSAGSRWRRRRRTAAAPSSAVSSLLHERRRRRAARRPAASAPASADGHHVAGDLPLELGRRALGDDLAVVDDGDPVAERVGLVEVVGGEEDGHALVAQPAHLVPHVGAALRVEAGGRLVEEDDLRLVDDAERDVDPAPLAAGVGLALAVGVLGELEGVQRVGGAPLAPRPCRCRTAGPAAPAPRGRSTRPRCCRPGRRSRCAGAPRPGRVRRSAPAMVASPPSGSISVASIRSVVVLPAPLGPRKPKISPSATSRSTPRTASTVFFSRPCRERNDFRKPVVSIIYVAPRLSRRLSDTVDDDANAI